MQMFIHVSQNRDLRKEIHTSQEARGKLDSMQPYASIPEKEAGTSSEKKLIGKPIKFSVASQRGWVTLPFLIPPVPTQAFLTQFKRLELTVSMSTSVTNCELLLEEIDLKCVCVHRSWPM